MVTDQLVIASQVKMMPGKEVIETLRMLGMLIQKLEIKECSSFPLFRNF